MRGVFSYKLRKRVKKIVIYCLVVFTTAVVSFPLYWMVVSSIKPRTELFSAIPKLLPSYISLDAYRTLLITTNFPLYLRNSFIVAIPTTIIVVLLTCIGGYGLTRFKFRGSQSLKHGVLLAYLFPPIVFVIPIYVLMTRIRINDTPLSLILVYTSLLLPLGLWIMMEFFATIPRDLENAAMVDGATQFQVFFKILIPLSIPAIIAVSSFTFMWSWGEFLYALVLIRSESVKTLPPGIAGLLAWGATRWDHLMAGAVICVLPVLILFIPVQKYLVRGIMAGAVKE